jgi:methylenetetrahydrofolate reductase (NADPH)
MKSYIIRLKNNAISEKYADLCVAQARKFATACGAAIPAWMDGLFEGLDEKPAARHLVAATVAAELCRRLYAGGVRDFHFYTLNRPELAYAICHMLGKRPVESVQ